MSTKEMMGRVNKVEASLNYERILIVDEPSFGSYMVREYGRYFIITHSLDGFLSREISKTTYEVLKADIARSATK